MTSPLAGMLSGPRAKLLSWPLILVPPMSVTMLEHSERMRLSICEMRTVKKSELARLGLRRQRMGVIEPYGSD